MSRLSDYDVLGALDDLDSLGEVRRMPLNMRVPARRSVMTAAPRQNLSAQVSRLVPPVPGAPTPGMRQFALGFPVFTFVNAGATAATLTANPQRSFRGERLIVSQRRSGGAVAELVSLTAVIIGANSQLISADPIPIDAFNPDSVGTMLALDPAGPGTIISLQFSITAAPGVGETVSIQPMLIGPTFT
jgi:hypothetical protein